jgi:hypothetical protein
MLLYGAWGVPRAALSDLGGLGLLASDPRITAGSS